MQPTRHITDLDTSVSTRISPGLIESNAMHEEARITKRMKVAILLYNYLRRFSLRLFLDHKSMKPGDKLVLAGGKC